MTEATTLGLLCPHQLNERGDKDERRLLWGMRSIARRVAIAALVRSHNVDVMAEVYMAGIYHGMKLGSRRDGELAREEKK